MAKKSSRRVAILITSNSTSSWRKLEGFMAFAHRHPEWEVAVFMSERVEQFRRDLRAFAPDGILCALVSEETMAHLATLQVPTVVAFHPDHLRARPASAVYVASDSRRIGVEAARFLYGRGYRSFLCVARLDAIWEQERFDAFEKELAQFQCRVARLPAGRKPALLLRTLKDLPPRSAVFASDDRTAVDLLNLARQNALAVPRDFGVLGVSDLSVLCDYAHPPLSSIDQNFGGGGFLAAQRLDSLLSGGLVPAVSFYPPGRIRERQTTPALHAPNPYAVDCALGFIARNPDRPIEVADVVAAVKVSRRTLETLFRQTLDVTPAELIRAVRLDFLARRLVQSDATLAEVCLSCGWPHAEQAMRLFKRRFKMTMSAYRRARG